ncbi:MAG: putative monovalent cation/H+ antiporter subunit A [Anaerolineae bacterium]|nr:putative monovalent cation/H+ antiporter subunit A [Anaerolineae bacterium]
MLYAVVSGFGAALVAPLIHQSVRRWSGWLLVLLPLALFGYFASYMEQISDGEKIAFAYTWVPSLDVELAFMLDGLSLLFVLLVSGIGALIVLYGSAYLADHPQLGRFYAYLLMFMASMLGVALADNLITLFIFWELTSISSYLLIAFKHDYESSREAAKKALIVTGAGGLALLAGLILVGIEADTWTISELASRKEVIQEGGLYLPALLLILVGCFAKSAQFPFHFWLPYAMEAPTPVSAYLHSATMVKAGVYLLARLHPSLGGTDEWHAIVTGVGGLTMLIGGFIAWQHTDLKKILAYTTISALGILVFLLGIGTGLAVKGAMIFLLVHSLYKGALFMVAGSIDHETGTRDIAQLGDLGKPMPFTAVGAGLAALSMAGLPPLLGFIGKEIIYEATQEAHDLLPLVLTAAALLANIFNVAAAAMVTLKPFTGQAAHTPKHPHEAPLAMWIGPVVLGGFTLAFGVASNLLLKDFFAQTVAAVYGKPYEVKLGLWHGLNTTLVLSVVTLVAGGLLYAYLRQILPIVKPLNVGEKLGPDRLYDIGFEGILDFASLTERFFQNGHLRYYLMTIIFTLSSLLILTMTTQIDFDSIQLDVDDVLLHEYLLAGLMIAAAITITMTSSRLMAVAALGVVGYSVALLYVFYGAPDLAMTQFSIETLSVVVLVLVLYRLPKFKDFSTPRSRTRDGIIAVMFGGLVTTLILIITSEPLQSRLSPYFAENSYVLAKGHNVVNVILVDFRGFDTMGEITVLGVAAIGIFALLKLRPSSRKEE